MGHSVNKVTVLGYVGKDPEVKAIPSGMKVANFSIATDEGYVDKKTNQKVEKTEWHNLVAWSGLAQVIESYVKKGSKLYIEGKLQTRSWDDKDGKKQYRTEIVVDQMIMLGDKGGAKPAAAAQQQERPASAGPGLAPDDGLPF